MLSHIIVTRPLTPAERRATGFVTRHVLTDTRKLLYYWRRLPDDRIMFGGRGTISDGPGIAQRQRDFLLAELKNKLPGLEALTVEYDWYGWICLTRDFLPHVSGAEDDASVHYALGYQGSGVSFSLYAGKLLAWAVAGRKKSDAVPPVMRPLRPFRLHRLLRIAQVPVYRYFRMHDRMDLT